MKLLFIFILLLTFTMADRNVPYATPVEPQKKSAFEVTAEAATAISKTQANLEVLRIESEERLKKAEMKSKEVLETARLADELFKYKVDNIIRTNKGMSAVDAMCEAVEFDRRLTTLKNGERDLENARQRLEADKSSHEFHVRYSKWGYFVAGMISGAGIYRLSKM